MELIFDIKMCSPLHQLCVILIVLLVNVIHGFNIDTTKYQSFQGPRQGSYYGFSIAMLNQNDVRWILIGAPKDNSTFLPSEHNPGAIYKCTITDTSNSCQEQFIDDKTEYDSEIFTGIRRAFRHGRTDQMLGASLDVNRQTGIVTCASNWYNTYFLYKGLETDWYMNGLCYEIPLDFNTDNIKKIPALVDGNKQVLKDKNNVTTQHYSYGGLGLSAHYTSQGEDLLLGTPGLHTWTGGFVDMRGSDAYITEYIEKPTENSEMAGYAMTSGNYLMNLRFFAIGAPRDHLTGKVFLFSAQHTKYILENADVTIDGSELTEIPINGFFGGALCSVDVNNDGSDDLIVAAPFYSKGIHPDTGVVFVYLGNRDALKFKPQTTFLTGSEMAGGRFGSAMASLGDINKDSYNDVVISAPYENDGQGAIYIYNGCSTGLWPKYSQKIEAATLRPGLMSFGSSFSKAEDMNNDVLNDIAVGSYLSDEVHLLYGRSVINIKFNVKASVEQIDKDTTVVCTSLDGISKVPCFKIQACFQYEDKSYGEIDLKVTLKLDTYMLNYNRIMFNNGLNSLQIAGRVFSGRAEQCFDMQDVLIKSTSDLVTPVRLEATYDVISISGPAGIRPTVNQFDGSNPGKQLLISSKNLDFKKDCPNNDCQTDLKLSVQPVYDRTHSEFYIIGTSGLGVDVSISKTGDPSYSSNFFVALPNTLQFQKITKIHGDTEISCGFIADADSDKTDDTADDTDSLEYLQRQNIPEISKDEVLMMCAFGNPMSNDTGVRFLLNFHVPSSVNSTSLTFRLNATTLSTELNATDNVKTITVNVRNKVTTTFTGVSRPSYITIKEKAETYQVSHVYEMKNKGPSPLPSASMMIQYPQIQQSGRPLLHLNITSWSCPPPCRIVCSYPDTEYVAPVVHAAHIGPTYVVNQDNDDENIGESREISNMKNSNCDRSDCSRYECELYDIPPSESAVVVLEFVATGDILEATTDGNALRLKSISYVSLKQLNRLIYETIEHYTDVGTDLLPVSPPPQKVAWWIYLVSILAGIILIIIVVLILWKLGFFKRKRAEDMKPQHQAEVEKMLDDNDAEGGNGVKS